MHTASLRAEESNGSDPQPYQVRALLRFSLSLAARGLRDKQGSHDLDSC